MVIGDDPAADAKRFYSVAQRHHGRLRKLKAETLVHRVAHERIVDPYSRKVARLVPRLRHRKGW
jgi:hypothetical protein